MQSQEINCPHYQGSQVFRYDGPEWQEQYGRMFCSYCGSVHPEAMLEMLASQEWEAGPTDKNYKVYLRRATDNEQFKFYFGHMNEEQMRTFIDFYNKRLFKIGYPGAFYVLPYFMVKA